MNWMVDEIFRKASQQRAVTGTNLPSSTMEGAIRGALMPEYEMSFRRGANERAIESQEKTAAEQRALDREKLAMYNTQFEEKMDFEKEGRTMNAISGIATAALTNADKIGNFLGKASDYLSPSNSAAFPGDTGPAMMQASLQGTTPAVSQGVAGLSSEFATGGALETANYVPGMFGMAAEEGVAAGVEQAVASSWASQTAMATGITETAATGVVETSFLSQLGSGLTAIGAYVPFVGLAFAAASFIFPGFGEKVTDAVGDAAETVWSAVTSVFDGSVVCTELERQGYLPFDVLLSEGIARILYVNRNAYDGYLRLFKPYVEVMKQDNLLGKIATLAILPFGRAIAYELASKVNSKYKGSFIGKMILKVGIPICESVNKRCLHECY